MTMALSFNHQGPFGGFYRYIGAEGTYHVFRETIKDGEGEIVAGVDGATPAFEVQDRAFVDAVRTGARPECDAEAVLPAMRLLDRIERALSKPPAA